MLPPACAGPPIFPPTKEMTSTQPIIVYDGKINWKSKQKVNLIQSLSEFREIFKMELCQVNYTGGIL